uniref:prophage tail fiber N-terminal domain-containing protein n=1 Tax=Escherichia coli TaxID=562 RepID=UPI00201D7D28
MAVKISGVLKDGTGKPVENCTIQLKAGSGGLFCGVNMAVKISGVLKDGTGKPVENCTIQLKA